MIDLEVLQAVRLVARTGPLAPCRAAEASPDYADLRIVRFAHLMLAASIGELRENAAAYDAAYLALSEALGAALLTCDSAQATVPAVLARIEVA